MPAVRRRWTTAAVRALMDESRAWPRYELIEGELVVTPAPARAHQLMVLEIAASLHAYLEREPVGVVATSPADLEICEGTITQPDVFVMPVGIAAAANEPGWSQVRSLLLAVEVISPSTVRMDRIVKRDFYLGAEIEEYWIVDIDARMLERWTPSSETPEVLREEVVWSPSHARAPFALDLLAAFERVARKLAMLGG